MSPFNIGETDKDYFAVMYNKKPIFSISTNGKAFSSDQEIDGMPTTPPSPGPNFESLAMKTWSIGHTASHDLIFLHSNHIIAMLTQTGDFYVGGELLMSNFMMRSVLAPQMGPHKLQFGDWTFGGSSNNDAFLFAFQGKPVLRIPSDGQMPSTSPTGIYWKPFLPEGNPAPPIGAMQLSVFELAAMEHHGVLGKIIVGTVTSMQAVAGFFNGPVGNAFHTAANSTKHFFTHTIGHGAKHFFTHTINPSHW